MEAKKNDFWIAIPYFETAELIKTREILTKRSIDGFRGEVRISEDLDMEKEPVIELSRTRNGLETSLKYRKTEKEMKKVEIKVELKDMKGKMKEKDEVVLKCTKSGKRQIKDI